MLRWKVYSLGYAKHVTDRIFKILEDTSPEIRKELLNLFATGANGRLSVRLKVAEQRLTRIRGRAWNQAERETVAALIDLFDEEIREMVRASPTKLSLPDPKSLLPRVLVVGHNIKDWFKSFFTSDLRRLIGQVRISVLAGESLQQLFKRIMGKLSAVMASVKRAVSSIIPTAISAWGAKVKDAMASLNSDVFNLELWVSILDNRTTKGCFDLHGKTFERGKGIQPGYHFYCRSDRIPLFTDGGSSVVSNYSAWIGTQDARFKRYVGEGEFSYNNLRPLSLQQVKERISGSS